MNTLYPELHCYQSQQIQVDAEHSIYVEESGNPTGIPVLFVHGGPGGGCSSDHRRFFDPQAYRIVLFDQRGCGRSTPHGSLNDNTTEHLVSDMEVIRQHLNIEQWLLFGGSWGSTLSLAYAQAHPHRVLGLVLRGIFLCRKRDIDWFYQDGANHIFPDYWQEYLSPVEPNRRHELLAAYYDILTGDDETKRLAAARAWSVWEGRCSTLQANSNLVDHFNEPHVALAMARIEAHYFINNAFLSDDELLKKASILENIPTWIVHGRYDMVCPIEQALLLHNAIPHAELNIIADAGHSAFEPGITARLIEITDSFAKIKREI